MKTQLWVAHNEGMLDDATTQKLVNDASELMKQVSALHSALEKRGKNRPGHLPKTRHELPVASC